jgi:hypothetical protein
MSKKVKNTKILENYFEWLFGGNPNAIEAQEKRGQEQFVTSSQLPKKINNPRNTNPLEFYPKLGIKVFTVSKGDDLFFGVELPKGWKKIGTDHDMWSELHDDKGRKRAGIFYKAAFYDRDAFIDFEQRITYKVNRLGFLNNDYSQVDGDYVANKTPFVGRVVDFDDTVLFETQHMECDIEYVHEEKRRYYSEEYKEKSDEIEKYLNMQCLDFLIKNFKDYKNVLAYW